MTIPTSDEAVRSVVDDLDVVLRAGRQIELQDNLKELQRPFHNRLRLDGIVTDDIKDLGDILPDQFGNRDRRRYIACDAILGTDADLVRHLLHEMAEQIREQHCNVHPIEPHVKPEGAKPVAAPKRRWLA